MRRSKRLVAATLAAFVPLACSGNDKTADTIALTTTVAETVVDASTTIPLNPGPLDFNGDGQVVFGVATTGPVGGGGWSQQIADAVTALSTENGFAEPIVIENVQPAEAVAEIGRLAEQAVDLIILGAPAIAAPLADVIAQHPDIYWYCNCGAGIPENPGLAQVTDNGAEIGYTAGYATGLLLKESGGRRTTVIGCCDHGFEKQIWRSYEAGLQAVDRTFKMTYVRTGDSEYDFDDEANATAAFRTAVDERTNAVFPYLDGAHRAVVQAANEADVITLSAGSRAVCEDSELRFDISVGFDGGEYLRLMLPSIVDGTFREGQTRAFKVGVDPQTGTRICTPTPEQQAAMDALYAQIAAGELNDVLAKITEKAFAAEVLAEDLLD